VSIAVDANTQADAFFSAVRKFAFACGLSDSEFMLACTCKGINAVDRGELSPDERIAVDTFMDYAIEKIEAHCGKS